MHVTFENNASLSPWVCILRGFQMNLYSCSLPCVCRFSLSGFKIKTKLHSRTVLDSIDRDYLPWSFYRQETVLCKTLPEGLTTSLLTDCTLACIREEKENGFIPFDPPLDLRERRISGARAVNMRPVTTWICLQTKKEQGFPYYNVRGIWLQWQQVQPIILFVSILCKDKTKWV